MGQNYSCILTVWSLHPSRLWNILVTRIFIIDRTDGNSITGTDWELWSSSRGVAATCWEIKAIFVANQIMGEAKAEKTWATFLSVVGRSSYTLLQSLIANQQIRPLNNWWKSSKPYSPQPTEVMQHFRFNSYSKKEGESIADYVVELQRLAEFCNYGKTLDKMLRDASIQKKLLGNPS